MTEVGKKVLRSPHEAHSARIESLTDRCRIPEKIVGRRHGIKDELSGKARLCVLGCVERRSIQQLGDELAA